MYKLSREQSMNVCVRRHVIVYLDALLVQNSMLPKLLLIQFCQPQLATKEFYKCVSVHAHIFV